MKAIGFTKNSKLGKLLAAYLKNLQSNERSFDVEVDKFILLLIDSWKYCKSYNSFDTLRPFLRSLIKKEGITRPEQLFEKRLKDLPEFMMDKEYAALFRTYLTHLKDYPYNDIRRLQFRRKNIEYYLEDAMALFQYFVIFSAARSVELKYFKREDPFIKHWWASGIMSGNEGMIQALKNVLKKEETASCLCFELYSAIVLSDHRELIDMMIKQMASPRVTGDARRTMADAFSYSSSKTFLYFLAALCDFPKLREQASVKKKMAYWLRMDDRASSRHITAELIFYVTKLLGDEEHLQAALERRKAFDYYMVFWAKSFYSLDEVVEMGESIIKGDDREKVQAFFLFIREVLPDWRLREFTKMALPLWCRDTEVVATFIGYYLSGASFYEWKVRDKHRPRLVDCYDSLKEARSHYELLKSLYPSMKTRYEFPSPVFPFRNLIIWRSNFVQQMCNIAFVTGDKKMLEETRTLVTELSAYGRDMFLCHLGFAKTPSSRYYIW